MHSTMKNNVYKYLKLIMGKTAVVLVVFVYLLGPIQKEVSNLLHAISHKLVQPDMALAHFSQNNKSHVHNNASKLKVSKTHKHSIIAFITTIFKLYSNNEDPLNKTKLVYKLKKYIVETLNFSSKNKSILIVQSNAINRRETDKICNGYAFAFKEPPEIF